MTKAAGSESHVIVVGVDGSRGAEAALRFAAAEAALRNAKLRIVCAWEIPAAAYAATWGMAAEEEPRLSERADDVAAAAVAETARIAPAVDCELRTAHGQPSRVLLGESEDADLIVVGSRGLSELRSLLLGSVSQEVAHHATCPVVIVPTPPDGGSGDSADREPSAADAS